MAFDSVNSHLYWAEHVSTGQILRCNPDGSNVTTIVKAYKPLTLTIDTHNRFVMLVTQCL